MKRLSAGYLILFVLAFVLAVVPAGCGGTAETGEKIGVVVTILPQAEFVERVGGDRVEVAVMVPPGASPHTYEPVPSQLVKLAEAEMYAKVGSGIDFELAWMDKLIATNDNMLVVDCSEGVALREMTEAHEHEDDEAEAEDEHEAGSLDPHIWLSPGNAAVMVRNIAAGLVRLDPASRAYYERNRDKYLEELEQLDSDISEGLAGVENRVFMVYHAAFGYLAGDYGLTQLPVAAGGKEPTPAGLQHLIEQAREHNIKVVFVEPQFNPQSAEVIAGEIGGSVVFIDPLDGNYLDNMRAMAEKLVASME